MNLTLDKDGTITACPALFTLLSEAVHERGGRVCVITSRADTPEVERRTKQELAELGIAYDELFIIPAKPGRQIPRLHNDLTEWQQYLWQKVQLGLDYKVDAVFEDDIRTVELFREYAPAIRVYLAR